MNIGTQHKTSYGLEYTTITKEEWDTLEPLTHECNWTDYDRMMVGIQIANCGYGILSTEYGTPIDNEYDLEEIYKTLGA